MILLQEPEGQKTNNGIQYRLQLLYSNGEYLRLFSDPHGSLTAQRRSSIVGVGGGRGRRFRLSMRAWTQLLFEFCFLGERARLDCWAF